MVDDTAGVHVSQRLVGQSLALFFLLEPGGHARFMIQRTRAFSMSSHLIGLQ